MNQKNPALTCLAAAFWIALPGCGGDIKAGNPKGEAPPTVQIEVEGNSKLIRADHPEQFPVVAAGRCDTAPELNVTGTVTPDVSRNIPVISIASGRVLEIHARLGDTVSRGQLLLRVQSADAAGAFSDYRQALADRTLARAQMDRSKLLLDKGAIARKDYEVAVDTAEKAEITVETTEERLRVMGADKDHPTSVVDILAPVSGVIIEQQVTQGAGVQGLAAPANPFTISDLSHVWIQCDVFENDLRQVAIGEIARLRMNAYPDRVFRARVSSIGPILDPNIRTAKVRLEVDNPGGLMRIGMFVTATLYGSEKQVHALAPATAILHLQDRDWVYEPFGAKSFRRVAVIAGSRQAGDMQEVTGINPGDQVVRNALALENSVEQ